MTEPEDSLHSLMPILRRFPSESARIRQLAQDDEHFRCLLEDYILSRNTLRQAKQHNPPDQKTAVEYTAILADLEQEIFTILLQSRGPG